MKHYLKLLFLCVALIVGNKLVSAQDTTTTMITPSGQTASAVTNSGDRYRIGYQDLLDITVYRRPEFSTKVAVSPNGMIYLNRVDKPLSAVCKTELELAEDIKKAYLPILRHPEVTVFVSEQKSQSMSVIGAVEKPGLYFLGRRVHLLELLAMAGGPNKEAGTRLIVARTGSTSNCQVNDLDKSDRDQIALVDFKIDDVQQGKKSMWMQPGDVVSVMDADYVYVYGNVIKPGRIPIREPITLTQAIATSEGFKPATDKSSVRILRQKPDSIEREEIIVNLSDIEKRRANDPYLEPNDIVAISKDKMKDILLGLGNAIKAGIPSAITRGIPVP